MPVTLMLWQASCQYSYSFHLPQNANSGRTVTFGDWTATGGVRQDSPPQRSAYPRLA
jgi:hypothetical protein